MGEASDRAKKVQVSTRDIISNLPGNVIDRILELLPIRDAVKTSALARSWRYNWAAISKLNFDHDFCQYMYISRDMPEFYIASIITKFLLLHDGPIHDFTLYIPGRDEAIKGDIDNWILFLSRKHVKEFKLVLYCYSGIFIYKLPTHLFSCLSLTHLNLIRCVFNPPSTFRGFPNLTDLSFSDVTFEKESFEYLISSCPLLEYIFFESCLGPDQLNIYSPSLVQLHIDCGKPEFICISRAENLRFLALYEVSWIVENPENGVSNVIKELGKTPKIEDLCFGGPSGDSLKFLSAGGAPSRLPTPLKFLRNITFCLLDFGDPAQILAAFCIIRSAPRLRDLAIIDISDAGEPLSTDVSTLLEEVCVLSRLKVVTIYSIKCTRVELQFIKSILISSPSLKSMFLSRDEAVDEKVYSLFTGDLLASSFVQGRKHVLHV